MHGSWQNTWTCWFALCWRDAGLQQMVSETSGLLLDWSICMYVTGTPDHLRAMMDDTSEAAVKNMLPALSHTPPHTHCSDTFKQLKVTAVWSLSLGKFSVTTIKIMILTLIICHNLKPVVGWLLSEWLNLLGTKASPHVVNKLQANCYLLSLWNWERVCLCFLKLANDAWGTTKGYTQVMVSWD